MKEQESALHEALTHCLAVDFDCLGERNESLVVIADSLETIALAQVTQSIVLLQLNDGTEIAEGLFPLLLEDFDVLDAQGPAEKPKLTETKSKGRGRPKKSLDPKVLRSLFHK